MGWLFLGLLCYFLVVLSERALVALSPGDAERWRNESGEKAKRLLKLAENIKPTLAALLLARIFLTILMVVFSVAWLSGRLPEVLAMPFFSAANGVSSGVFAWAAGAIWVAGLSAVLWGIQRFDISKAAPGRAAGILERLERFIFCWKTILAPFIGKEKKRPDLREKNPPGNSQSQQEEEFASKNAEKREMEMLKSIVKFSDVTVRQVMQPRPKVVAADFRLGFSELLKLVRDSGFSRLPVFDDDLDNVTGILYVKDLVPHLDKTQVFEWQALVRPNVLLVPESKRISELLAEFKKQKMHLAVVVDEFGGSAGIVTMEDILEEVTGEIRDEFDDEQSVNFTKLDEHNYLFEGRVLLEDVCRTTGLDPATFQSARADADTLAGFALELHGDIPKKGTEIRWKGFVLTVSMADARRVEQIKFTLPRSGEGGATI